MTALTPPTSWKAANLALINERLKALREAPHFEKIIQGELQGIFLRKLGDVLEMYCYDNDTQKLSNIMSRIDLNNPLNLIGPYSQAVFLSAFWNEPSPNNIYIAGYGGGRLAMLFGHYFPSASLHGSDIDPNVLSVASDYFGLGSDVLKDVKAADSREDIAARNALYDIIFLDVFVGGGEHVNHLATRECFKLYKSKLSTHGVLVANLVVIDNHMEQKIAAMQAVFKHCYVWEHDGAHVVFASNQALKHKEFIEHVKSFQTYEKLEFDLTNQARHLKPCMPSGEVAALCDKDL